MNNEKNNNVSSLNALISSIKTDKQVYRWFTLSVTQPALSSKLKSIDTLSKIYDKLKKTIFQQRLLLVFILLSVLILIATKNYIYLSACILLLIPLTRLSNAHKDCVIHISDHMLTHDFDKSDLPTKTLYQICELYSRQYNIPSLVDTIYAQDNISRKTIIFTFVFTAWLYPLANICAVFLSVIVAYNVILAFTNTSLIYKNLK